MKPGDIVNAKITNILGYGAFVVVGDYDGLVHIIMLKILMTL